MAFYKRRRRGYVSYSRKKRRTRGSFRAGAGRRLRSTRFSRRSYAPGLTPESKYADSAYGYAFGVSNFISPGVGSGTLLLDANGPATAAADTNAGGAGVVGIASGAAFNQRIGRKIFLKYISIRMRAYWLQLVATGGPYAINTPLTQRVRIMLFYDRQPNLALPSNANVVMNINPGLTVDTFQEDSNRDRFVRLMDQSVVITANQGASPGAANDNSMCIINKVVKIGGIQVYNDVGTGGVGSIQTGSLFFLFLWDQAGTGVVASAPPVLDLVTRLRYSDL